MCIRFNGKFLSETPKESELKRLTVLELFQLAKNRRSIKHPLKKCLIEYIISLGKLN